MGADISKEAWFLFLEHGQQDLVTQAHLLYERERSISTPAFHDYSFVVFPMAKAYEGFLKRFFYRLGIISQTTMEGDNFRIGKSLNPDLPERFRDHEWLVSELDSICGSAGGAFEGQLLSRVLWKRWKTSRNLLFHYFPQHENFITLDGAGSRLAEIREAIKAALVCHRAYE